MHGSPAPGKQGTWCNTNGPSYMRALGQGYFINILKYSEPTIGQMGTIGDLPHHVFLVTWCRGASELIQIGQYS